MSAAEIGEPPDLADMVSWRMVLSSFTLGGGRHDPDELASWLLTGERGGRALPEQARDPGTRLKVLEFVARACRLEGLLGSTADPFAAADELLDWVFVGTESAAIPRRNGSTSAPPTDGADGRRSPTPSGAYSAPGSGGVL